MWQVFVGGDYFGPIEGLIIAGGRRLEVGVGVAEDERLASTWVLAAEVWTCEAE